MHKKTRKILERYQEKSSPIFILILDLSGLEKFNSLMITIIIVHNI